MNNRTFEDEPYVDPAVLAEANRKHDMENGSVKECFSKRIRSSWKSDAAFRGKALTDKVIAKYEKRGRYTDAYKQALRELFELKSKQKRTYI